jgi:hypothetical protein
MIHRDNRPLASEALRPGRRTPGGADLLEGTAGELFHVIIVSPFPFYIVFIEAVLRDLRP